MRDDLAARDAQARAQLIQQADQGRDLCRCERRVAIVVDLDADRGRVEIGDRAPAPGTGVPCAAVIAHQLVDVAIGADQVVRADLAATVGAAQRIQALLHGVLIGVVQHDHHWRARVVVRRRHPGGERAALLERRGAAGGQGQRQQGGQRQAIAGHGGILPGERKGL
ncbi:hypothetical protein D3C71_1284380 [compost metagenome]